MDLEALLPSTPLSILLSLLALSLLAYGLLYLLTQRLQRTEAQFLNRCLSQLSSRPGLTAVVTGATAGIGEKLTELLAGRAGLHVYLCYRSVDRGLASRARILALHPTAHISLLPLDVEDPRSVRAAAALLAKACGPSGGLDFLVANAGVMPVERLRWGVLARALCCCRLGTFLETGRPGQGWAHFMEGGGSGSQLATHVLGHLLLAQLLQPQLARSGGRVVWSASRAADCAAVDWGQLSAGRLPAPAALPREAYAESKAVMELVSRGLPARLGLPSVCVCPGFVMTAMAPPFFAAMSPLFLHTRVLAPSMTLALDRGCAAHLGAMVLPAGSLQGGAKYVLQGGCIAPTQQGLVEAGMEEQAWAVCQEQLKAWGGEWGVGSSSSSSAKASASRSLSAQRGGKKL